MKKLLLIAALLFASYGVFADEFDEFVQGAKGGVKNIPNVIAVRADKAHRILFFDFRLPDHVKDVSDEQHAEMKRAMIRYFKNSSFAEGFKELEVTVVYNYITADGKIYSVVISSSDL